MNKHKIFHRIGFAVTMGLLVGAAAYVFIASILSPLYSFAYIDPTNHVVVGIQCGKWAAVAMTIACLWVGTPWDEKLTISEKE